MEPTTASAYAFIYCHSLSVQEKHGESLKDASQGREASNAYIHGNTAPLHVVSFWHEKDDHIR